jgi:rare lipoprotein A
MVIVISGFATIRGAPGPANAQLSPNVKSATTPAKVKEQPAPEKVAAAKPTTKTISSRGIASFYGVNTNGTRTASGVPLRDSLSTAAHRTLPFGTLVRVTNLRNDLQVTVKITDRGPFIKGRIIDLSRGAARKIDMIEAGIVSVEIEVLPAAKKPILPSLAAD